MLRGYHNGRPVYDYVGDVPDYIMMSGDEFIVLNPPREAIDNKALVMEYSSPADPITWTAVALFVAKLLMIVLVGVVVIQILQQLGYIFQGRPGKKIDDNLFEGGDGSVWARDPETGEWKQVKGSNNQMLIWGVIAVFVVAIILILVIQRRSIFGSGAGSNNPGSKKKHNPGRPPKKWWDQKYKEVKKGNPDYSEEQIRETVGDIWHNKLTEEKKREILRRYEK